MSINRAGDGRPPMLLPKICTGWLRIGSDGAAGWL